MSTQTIAKRTKSPFDAWVVRPEVSMVVTGKVIHSLDARCVKGTPDPKRIQTREWAVEARKAEAAIVAEGGDRQNFFCTRCLIADPAGHVLDKATKAVERDAQVTEFVEAIKAYAQEHYDDGKGWDVVVEAYDDDQLADMIGRARTTQGAIKKVAAVLATIQEVREDALAAAGEDPKSHLPY